jgi:phosphoribosylglycinamide formyltransferase-1
MRAQGPPLAVLASGRGSNFVALARASASGRLAGRVVLLLSDRAEAPVLRRAAELGVAARCIDPGPFRTRLTPEAEAELVAALKGAGAEAVLLAGFMRVLHDTFLAAFPGRVLNVHPSLLPAFPGLAAPRRALEHGVRITGCTVHLVDATLDGGPILAQAAVPVLDGDDEASLTGRIQEAEHALYPATVRRFLIERPRVVGRRVVWEGAP